MEGMNGMDTPIPFIPCIHVKTFCPWEGGAWMKGMNGMSTHHPLHPCIHVKTSYPWKEELGWRG
jgi:hypothetical protein